MLKKGANKSGGRGIESTTATLFVGKMSVLYTKQIVMELFGKFGNVINVDIIQGAIDPKIFTGFGFVTFETVAEAVNAKESLHGFERYGRKLKYFIFCSVVCWCV